MLDIGNAIHYNVCSSTGGHMPKPNRVTYPVGHPKHVAKTPAYNPNYIDHPLYHGKKLKLTRQAYDFLAANPKHPFSSTLLKVFAAK